MTREQKRTEMEKKRKKKFTKLKNKKGMANFYDSKKGRNKKISVKDAVSVAESTPTVEVTEKKDMLSGYKTYIMGAMAVASVGMAFLGWIDFETLVKLVSIFIAGEGLALRSALKKTEVKG